MKGFVLLLLAVVIMPLVALGQTPTDTLVDGRHLWAGDTLILSRDTIAAIREAADLPGDTVVVKRKKKPFYKKIGHALHLIIDEFNAIDSSYVEPQKYKFTAMVQGTYSFESYQLTAKSGQSIRFAPKAQVRVGPYFGWKLIFLGYTIGFSQIHIDSKKQIDLSLYTSAIGIDIFYRRTGHDYNIRSVDLGEGVDTRQLNGISFDGLKVGMTGFNIYYITNHRKFSYPAAFSQSTCQLRSCGSPIFGIGYTVHTMDLDYDKLQSVVASHVPETDYQLDEGLKFSKVKYKDFSISGGYAYNYVFTKNIMVAASLSLAVGYKHATGDRENFKSILRDFSFSNLNLDLVGRFGLIWNTSKWYAGSSAIIHSYNYKKSQFSTSNYFGCVNIYFGVNFGKKRHL